MKMTTIFTRLVTNRIMNVTKVKGPTIWEVETTERKLKYPSEYPVMYSIGGCTVSLHKSGEGVLVYAQGTNWRGKSILQIICIEKGTHGKQKEQTFWDSRGVREVICCRDMFKRYLKFAKFLPLDVRKAFLGFYALE